MDTASGMQMVEMVRETFDCREIITSRLGAVITTHLGPETWVVAFYPIEPSPIG